jgi:hypothetical protein
MIALALVVQHELDEFVVSKIIRNAVTHEMPGASPAVIVAKDDPR